MWNMRNINHEQEYGVERRGNLCRPRRTVGNLIDEGLEEYRLFCSYFFPSLINHQGLDKVRTQVLYLLDMHRMSPRQYQRYTIVGM